MKKNITMVIAVMMVMGLGIAAFAYTRTGGSSATGKPGCCPSSDSCPIKAKHAAGKETAAGHENWDHSKDGANCCPAKSTGDASATAVKADDGASCPMMKKDEASAAAVKTDKAASCPMMKKGETAVAEAAGVKLEKATSDSGCCCPCCNPEKTDAPVV